jgi:serine/threonine-protein kinase
MSDSAYRILEGKIMPGDRLGHFELMGYIGGGGMGRVFRAFDTRLARPVALKILSPDQAADEETRLRFQNEAQSAARLDHDNIARVYHVGEDRNLHYIVFEFIEGVNVRTLVERSGPLSLADAVSYTLQIAEALAHVSQRDVVHRDIKPSNVLITPEGRVKLIDMGLARLKQADPAAADLTASGVTLGTFDYISPEQARDPRNADVRSDLYSLGCTFFFMLTGRPPFPEGTVLQKLLQHQGDQPPDVRQFRPELPEQFARVLRKMLAKDPRHRYGTPAELVDDLVALAEEVGLRPVGRDGRIWAGLPQPKVSFLHRHLPWIAPVATLVCIVLLLDLFWSLEARRGQRQPPSSPSAQEEALDGWLGLDDSTAAVGDGSASETNTTRETEPPRSLPEVASPVAPHLPAGAAQARPDQGGGVAASGSKSAALQARPREQLPALLGNGPWDQFSSGRSHAEGLPFDPLRGGWSVAGGTLPGFGMELDDLQLWGQLFGTWGGATSPAVASLPAEAAPRRTGLLVVGEAAEGGNQFATLGAACSAAVNGDVIELRFNGPREEKPIKLANLRVTIRAGEGYHPLIVFHPTEPDPVKYARSMLTLTAGRLTLMNLSLELHVPREVPAENWSLLETRGAQAVRLEKCSLTIRNASGQLAAYHEEVAFFRAKSVPGADAVLGDAAAAASTPVATIELVDCIARGEAVFLQAEDLQPVRLLWENGLLVTTERLLTADGGEEPPRPGEVYEVDLRHVTAVVRGGLCRLSDSSLGPYQLAAEIRCANSIFIGTVGKPLVEQEGVQAADTLRRRITFNGDRNFYEGMDVFWTIDDLNPDTPPQSMDFEAWRAHWGPQRENLPSRAPLGWKKLPEPGRPVHAHTPDDYTLSDAVSNPALGAASDGHHAGCQPERLPQPLPAAEKTGK